MSQSTTRTRPSSPSVVERLGMASEEPQDDAYDPRAEYRAFGIARKAWGGEAMIDFVAASGDRQAFPYAHLCHVAFEPSTGLLLSFTEHKVVIQGRLLHSLYARLLAQRVTFVCEADPPTAKLQPPDQAIVTKLVIAKREEV